MGRKKRRSSKFKDSSTVIDMEEARRERQQRQQERQKKREKMEAKNKTPRSESRRAAADAGYAGSRPASDARSRQAAADAAAAESSGSGTGRGQAQRERYRDDGRPQGSPQMNLRHDRRKMALRRRKRNRTLIIAGVLVALAVMLVFSFGNIIVLKHDLHVAYKEQEKYEEEKEQLVKDLQQINDRENLEEQARDQMRLIMPGETLYIFPEDMAGENAQTDQESDQDQDKKEKEQEKQEE